MQRATIFLMLAFWASTAVGQTTRSSSPAAERLAVHVTVGELATGAFEGLLPGIGRVGTIQSMSFLEHARNAEGIEAGPEVYFGMLEDDGELTRVTRAMNDAGLKVLAETAMTTTSGRLASFSAVGESPVLSQSNGKSSIEYKKVGTQLDCVPVVLGSDRIRLEVRPRVSQIDDSRDMTVGGVTVPGIRVRQFDTAFELKIGQTILLAGLPQNRAKTELVIMIRTESAEGPRVARRD